MIEKLLKKIKSSQWMEREEAFSQLSEIFIDDSNISSTLLNKIILIYSDHSVDNHFKVSIQALNGLEELIKHFPQIVIKHLDKIVLNLLDAVSESRETLTHAA